MVIIPNIDTFRDLVATVLLGVAVIYSAVALCNVTRATRIGAILLVAALSLYSNSFGTYFAAIFIVATAVTELEFLEKLAAIIRGSKDYFDYKKSHLPVEEAKAKASDDVAQVVAIEDAAAVIAAETRSADSNIGETELANSNATTSNAGISGDTGTVGEDASSNNASKVAASASTLKSEEIVTNDVTSHAKKSKNEETVTENISISDLKQLLMSKNTAHTAYEVEQYALNHFEKRLGVSIQRNIRFSKKSVQRTVEFDGYVERNSDNKNILFEVKLADSLTLSRRAIDAVIHFSKGREVFHEITGRMSIGILIIVVPNKNVLKNKIFEIESRIKEMYSNIQFEVVDFKEIGFSSI